MKALAGWGKALLFAFAAIAAGTAVSLLPPIARFFAWVDANHTAWLIASGIVALLGLAVMLGGILDLVMEQDRKLSHEQAEDVERSVRMVAQPATWRAASYKVRGQAAGYAGGESFTLPELMRACRSGAWRRDRVWRRRILIAAGSASMAGGVLGAAFAFAPAPVKAVIACAFLFVAAMLLRGVCSARAA